MTDATEQERREERHAKATLIRLANSCDRAAARGSTVAPIAQHLDQDDYRAIAEILRDLANELP